MILGILMNCHGEEIKSYFENIPEIYKLYDIRYYISHMNLENTAILEEIKVCDILITNNIKNYAHLTYDNIKKHVKPSCKICKIEFIRFNGFFPFLYEQHLNGLCIYDESTQVSTYEEYRDFYVCEDTILSNFQESILKLQELDRASDIKFYKFFMDNYKDKLLFRDNNHISDIFMKYIIKEIIIFLDIKVRTDIDSLNLPYTFGFKFRAKPILNCVKKALGLSFDTSYINFFNKDISVQDYYFFIKESEYLYNRCDAEELFEKRFGI